MKWILLNVVEALRRADVVSETTDWGLVTCHVIVLPLSKESYDEVASELLSQDLSEEVYVANECSLQNDWDVRGVEEVYWEWLSVTLGLTGSQLELNLEVLEIYHDEAHENGGEEVAKVRSVLSLEGLIEAVYWVWFGHKEVESSNDSTFEFSSLISSNGYW